MTFNFVPGRTRVRSAYQAGIRCSSSALSLTEVFNWSVSRIIQRLVFGCINTDFGDESVIVQRFFEIYIMLQVCFQHSDRSDQALSNESFERLF